MKENNLLQILIILYKNIIQFSSIFSSII